MTRFLLGLAIVLFQSHAFANTSRRPYEPVIRDCRADQRCQVGVLCQYTYCSGPAWSFNCVYQPADDRCEDSAQTDQPEKDN